MRGAVVVGHEEVVGANEDRGLKRSIEISSKHLRTYNLIAFITIFHYFCRLLLYSFKAFKLLLFIIYLEGIDDFGFAKYFFK